MRDNLVRQRVDVISAVRFTLKSMGVKLRSPNTICFARHARWAIGEDRPEKLGSLEDKTTEFTREVTT